ncbi:MAG: hypothetical protein WBM84_14270 [Sedimenticolaceae bacterium]
MIQSDIRIIFHGLEAPPIALQEMANELFEEIEGFGDVEQSHIEDCEWDIFAIVESANAVNAVLGAMARLLSRHGMRASSVFVEVASKRGVLSELVS